MSSNDNRSGQSGPATSQVLSLRQDAEKFLRERAARSPDFLKTLSAEETQQILHELLVHQIELEMQNDELRRVQVELGAAGARYFDLYDLAPVGYVTISEKGVILEANLTAANLLGITHGEMIKQLFSRFILKENQDIYYLHRKKLFEAYSANKEQDTEPQAYELQMEKNDNTKFWAHLTVTISHNADCTPVCRITINDITRLKQAEEDATMLALEWESTFNASNDIFWILDNDQRILRLNKAAEKFFHHTCQDLIGKHCFEVVHKTSHPIPECPFLRSRQSLQREDMELQIGNGWFQVITDPIINKAGQHTGTVHIVSDITKRKQADEKIRKQLEELRRWQAVMIGREGRVMELKHEVNELCRRINEPIRYHSQEDSPADS
ncbi:MAG: PAS domain-containing protein [Proteobacteria bacterium]|nr:PAS domain-containing protein [Pseudomonadota bacterium]